jgi:hypothetical protein
MVPIIEHIRTLHRIRFTMLGIFASTVNYFFNIFINIAILRTSGEISARIVRQFW